MTPSVSVPKTPPPRCGNTTDFQPGCFHPLAPEPPGGGGLPGASSARGRAITDGAAVIDVYHCPKCARLLTCEGVVSVSGYELPVFQCEDCIVKKTIVGPDTEPIEMAYTFCVDASGRCFDPTEGLTVAVTSG